MSLVASTLSDAVKKLNTLYNTSSTPPNAGEEDYLIWTDLFNIAIGNWETEEGVVWRQLFVRLDQASDGDQTTSSGTSSYALPSDFKFPNSSYVWIGSGTQRTAFKVIKQEEIQLYPNDTQNWCYFLMNQSPTLEFNPNVGLDDNQAIAYNYYKFATPLAVAGDPFDMSDPLYAVYYALSELKKDEGDVSALQMAERRLEAMKTLNFMTAELQENPTIDPVGNGFGTIGNNPIGRS